MEVFLRSLEGIYRLKISNHLISPLKNGCNAKSPWFDSKDDGSEREKVKLEMTIRHWKISPEIVHSWKCMMISSITKILLKPRHQYSHFCSNSNPNYSTLFVICTNDVPFSLKRNLESFSNSKNRIREDK